MEAYCNAVCHLEDKFDGLELNHVPRKYNKDADELAKIASGRTTVLSVSRRPHLFAYLRQPPEKARPHCTARTGPRRPRPAKDLCARPATPRHFRTMTEYSFRGLFTLEGTSFRGLTDQGFEAWPVEGSTGTPDHQS